MKGWHTMVYTVRYLEYATAIERKVYVIAKNKWDAYNKAVYEVIPKQNGCLPYSAWVADVTYQNGNYRQFNTMSGKPV